MARYGIGVISDAVASRFKLAIERHWVTRDGHAAARDFVRTPIFLRKSLHSEARRGEKKADAAEHLEVFHRVGLLTNQLLGVGRVAFY